MPGILLILDDQTLTDEWTRILSNKHQVQTLDRFDVEMIRAQEMDYALVVLDAYFIDTDIATLEHVRELHEKTVIAGQQWSEEKQVAALAAGSSGYIEMDISDAALLKAVDCVIDGDVWIKRHLIPKVLDALISAKNRKMAQQKRENDQRDILQALSKREAAVARMIGQGESNKSIADKLFISERTVSASDLDFPKTEYPGSSASRRAFERIASA